MDNADFEKSNSPDFDQLLAKAKAGCEDARSTLLDQMQNYVVVAAGQKTIENLKHKCGASDIVQLTMLEVFKSFDNFRGNSEGELKAWVKSIVENQVKRTRRQFTAQKRDAFKEVSGDDTNNLANRFVDDQLTPQSDAIQKEDQLRMQTAISKLSDDYREVIELRSLQRKPFKEIAEKMKRSEDAVTKLWFRAITKLQEMLNHDDQSIA